MITQVFLQSKQGYLVFMIVHENSRVIRALFDVLIMLGKQFHIVGRVIANAIELYTAADIVETLHQLGLK
jgi:precorrin-6B methylase 2